MITPEIKNKLHEMAIAGQSMSYSPYSHYKVGCSLLLENGDIIKGCNIENGAFGPSVCAERVAILKARSETLTKIVAIYTVTDNCATSCGVCLQVISELAPDAVLLFANTEGTELKEYTLRDLFQPYTFEK